MKKYLFSLLAVLLMTACSSDDGDTATSDSPVPVVEVRADYRDSLSEYSKEAAKRLVGTWKEVYGWGWTPNSLEPIETNDYSYLQFFDDGSRKWFSDSLPWDSSYAAKELKQNPKFKAYAYRVCDDWKFDEKTQKLSGYVLYGMLDASGSALISEYDRYYLEFGGHDNYELFMIWAPEDIMNCFGTGVGYVRVE